MNTVQYGLATNDASKADGPYHPAIDDWTKSHRIMVEKEVGGNWG